MNIKSTSLVLALAAIVSAPGAMAASLQISGEIVEGSCVPSFNGNPSSITLPAIDKSTLQNTERANGMETTVTLECTGLSGSKNVALRFNGAEKGDGNLAADDGGAGVATGVAFAIYDQDDKQVKVNTDPTTFVPVDANTPATLKHMVYYVKTGETLQAGTTSATANLDIIYN